MTLFDGKLQASILDTQISAFLKGHPVGTSTLAIIQIGDNLASEKYIQLKLKLCATFGVSVTFIKLASTDSDASIFTKISELVSKPQISGVIIQLPLPRTSLHKVLNVIPEEKDIDLLSLGSLHRFYAGDFSRVSPVVRSFILYSKSLPIPLADMRCCVIGNGNLVGKPIAYYLKTLGATVTVLENYVTGTPLNYELVVLSAGVPKLVIASDLVAGTNVIDFGSTVIDGKVVGDLQQDALSHLGLVSTSPGGAGPLVVRYLLMNFLQL